MVNFNDLKEINKFEWEIPQSFRPDMRVPVRIFATRQLLSEIMDDKSLEQAINAATLPGLVGHVVVMPDIAGCRPTGGRPNGGADPESRSRSRRLLPQTGWRTPRKRS